MALFCWLSLQQASRVGNSTADSAGLLKYGKGKLHSCWRTVGMYPDWIIICKHNKTTAIICDKTEMHIRLKSNPTEQRPSTRQQTQSSSKIPRLLSNQRVVKFKSHPMYERFTVVSSFPFSSYSFVNLLHAHYKCLTILVFITAIHSLQYVIHFSADFLQPIIIIKIISSRNQSYVVPAIRSWSTVK